MSFKKGQGATEYLIILAVVIIIALIVVGAMGGIPGIGTGAKTRASASYWAAADMAIPAYAVTASNDDMFLNVRNNQRNSVSSLTVSVNSQSATCAQTSLSAGQQTNCTITDVTSCDSGDAYNFDVSIGYTDSATGASYTFTGDGNKLEGKCAT